MKNSMKRFLALILGACLVTSMAACAKKPQETKAQETTQTAAQAPETTKAAETTAAPETKSAEAAVTPMPEQTPVSLLHPVMHDYEEGKQDETNNMIYRIQAQFLSLNEEETAKYPAVDEAFGEDLNEYLYMHINEFIERFTENTKDHPLDLGGEIPFKETTEIYRADDRMCSILVNMYEFLGGAHGSTVLQNFNYNSEKRALVQLSEIVKDNDRLQEILVAELKKQYPDNQFFDLEKDIRNYVLDQPAADGKIAYVWTMDYDSVMIWFPEEALGPHADGSQMIDLAFADYPELFTYNYGAVPADFILNLVPDYKYDFAGRTAEVQYRMDENGCYAELAFIINGTESAFEKFFNKARSMYATRNGHEYIYVFTEGDDDEMLFTVYKIDGDAVTEEVPSQIGYLTQEYKTEEPIGGTYAASRTGEYPVDPTSLKVTLKPDGKWGKEKFVTVSIAEDGKLEIR